ncbi:MAG: arylsulfotransferase family protein [Verrucomicrobiota bacterium]
MAKQRHSMLEKLSFIKVEGWMVMVILAVGFTATMFYGWYLRHALMDPNKNWATKLAVKLCLVPDNALKLFESGLEFNADGWLVQRNPQIIDFEKFSGFKIEDPDFQDDGYLLVSAYSRENQISTIYLYDLKTQDLLWEWVPDYDAIVEMSDHLRQSRDEGISPGDTNLRDNWWCMHPYLTEDGNILTHGGYMSVMTMIDPQGQPVWTLDGYFHHSIERDADGNFVVNTLEFTPPEETETGREGLTPKDDHYLIVSPDGERLEEHSILAILERHGYRGLLHGVSGWENDLLHTNDVDPIHENDEYVQKGDLMISCRNISTVFLYRPSEDRILWLETGPWLNQHDVDYLGDGVFSIYCNNLIRGVGKREGIHGDIYTYDMKTGETATPFREIFAREEFYTPEQGRQRILRNGDAYVELTNAHEIVRISPEKVRWRYAHPVGEGEVGALHWARYFHRDELDLAWLDRIQEQPDASE